MKELWTFIKHNQGMAVGIIISATVLIWTYGCHSQVTSILYAPDLINRGELQIEVDTFIARAELKFADLDRQDQIKSTLFNVAIDFMQGGSVNPAAVAIVIGNILGLGAVIDNVRKRTLIQTLKNSAGAEPPQG